MASLPPSIPKIQAGRARISVSSHGSTAVFSELSATYPVKLLSPRTPQNNVAVVYLLSYGGGLVGGDRVELSVDVSEGASLVLLSQGSTKVFKTRSGQRLTFVKSNLVLSSGPTIQNMNFVVGAGSTLFLLPDPVTCFRDASYHQIQKFHLAGSASLVLLDWLTSGRKSLGEHWVFSRYHSVNEVFVDGKRVAKDVMLLAENDAGISLPQRTMADRLSPYSCYAMLLLYGSQLQDTICSINSEYGKLSVFKTKQPADLVWSLSPIDSEGHGAVIRVAGVETETVKKWLEQSLHGIEEIIGLDSYRRMFT